jgi:hypothetical protein
VESLWGERGASPVAVATPPPGEGKAEVGASRIPDTSWDTGEATDSEEAALFSRIRFGQFLELVKQTRFDWVRSANLRNRKGFSWVLGSSKPARGCARLAKYRRL